MATVSYVSNMTFTIQWPVWAALFSLAALKGVRPVTSGVLAAAMLGVIVFMAVGNALIGFPWQGSV